MWGPYHCISFAPDIEIFVDFGRHQIGQDWVSVHINNKTLRFEVPQIDTLLAQVLDDEYDAGNVELRILGGKQPDFPNDIVQFLTPDELYQRV